MHSDYYPSFTARTTHIVAARNMATKKGIMSAAAHKNVAVPHSLLFYKHNQSSTP
eukprot:c2024_g1_i1 orf=302-466(-)